MGSPADRSSLMALEEPLAFFLRLFLSLEAMSESMISLVGLVFRVARMNFSLDILMV